MKLWTSSTHICLQEQTSWPISQEQCTNTHSSLLQLTSLRPDIVLWHENPKEVTLVELTVCFETAFEAAVQRKTDKYLELREEARNRGYRAEIMTIEVGSRSVVSVKGFKSLLEALTPVSKREFRTFLITLA